MKSNVRLGRSSCGMKAMAPTFLRVMKEHDRKEVASHVFGLLIQIGERNPETSRRCQSWWPYYKLRMSLF